MLQKAQLSQWLLPHQSTTIQAQILEQIKILRDSFHTAIIFITHNLGVMTELADRVVVMYSGSIVEEAPVNELFEKPSHPYTQGLLSCIPSLKGKRKSALPVIKGRVPGKYDEHQGCPFAPRCPVSIDVCSLEKPPEKVLSERHSMRCWLYE